MTAGAPAVAAAQSGVLLVEVSTGTEPVAGAEVEIRAGETLLGRGLTDRTGRARLAVTRQGRFEVHVSAPGYRPHTEAVDVVPGHVRTLEVILAPAPYEIEGISVRADRVQIKRQDTEFGATVTETAIDMLPVAANTEALVALTPGARAGHVWGGASFQANSYLIDGLSANHPGLGGSMVQPSINWVERVEVRGLGAGAEYGGFQGGQVNVVTKRGANDAAGSLYISLQNDALSASNLVATEIGTEITNRYEVDGEMGGALVRNRLFYYAGAQRIAQTARVLNHLPGVLDRFSPFSEDRSDTRVFGKLTWTPRPLDLIEVSAGYFNTVADNFEMTGYEGPRATTAYEAPTWFGNVLARRTLGEWGSVEAQVNHLDRDERYEPYGGEEVPGIRPFALNPPYTSFGNAPFSLRSAPSSTSGRVTGTFRFELAGEEQLVRIGAEHTRGRFLDRRSRNGGMTWMPVSSTLFDPEDTETWSRQGSAYTVPTQWGGEVALDADVENTAGFVQAAFSVGPRVVVSPGLRWGRWSGWVNPVADDRFLAVRDDAVDPRVGLMVEFDSRGTLVGKAHWGLYHQDMMAQMFDRAAGSDVFTNEEIWYYRGPPPLPTTRFTEAERDAMSEQGLFTKESIVVLNETGPVVDYRQPYVEQWLVGFEKQFASSVKLEALYTRRSNRDMIALVDRNRATNYTRYERVRVMDAVGQPLPYGGGGVYLTELYIPNWAILEHLRYCAQFPDVCGPPPYMEFADTASLTWDPDYVLTNAPDGRREFGQFQLTAKVERPTWGGSFSVAITSLEGNLDNVTGYADPEEYSAGPYVRVNEGVNAYGTLPNFSEREAKVSVWGDLPWKLRGGAFWTYGSGDHYSPRFRLSGLGFYRYKVGAGASGQRGVPALPGEEIPYSLITGLEGHYVFVGPRGQPQLRRRANLDLRLERMMNVGATRLGVSLDVFNVFGFETIQEVNTMVNNGRDYYSWAGGSGVFGGDGPRVAPNQYYGAVLERVPPRVLRLGVRSYF